MKNVLEIIDGGFRIIEIAGLKMNLIWHAENERGLINMDNNSKILKELVYSLLQNPTRENFIDIISNSLGEQDNLDFKENWIDYPKIAEIILGIANSGGGVIIVGVKENQDGTFASIGLQKLDDKEHIFSKLKKYLPDTVKFEVGDYDFTNESYSKIQGKLFQILYIYSDVLNLPYIWNKNSDSNEAGCIFYRRGTMTIKANSQEIGEMIDKRIEATYIEQSNLQLEEHLKQLFTLYRYVEHKPNYLWEYYISSIKKNIEISRSISSIQGDSKYLGEAFENFIKKMIEKKKLKIEKILDLKCY